MPIEDDTPRADCYSCRQTLDPDGPARERVVRTANWRVAHNFESTIPGWLVVVPVRHLTTMAQLSAAEADELGGLLRRLSLALPAVVGCAKTYLMQFSEAEGFAHLHVHVVPRPNDLPDELRGPGVFGYLSADPSRQLPPGDMDQVSVRIAAFLDGLAT